MVAKRKGYDLSLVQGVPGASMERKAARPLYSVLGTEKGQLMPRLSNAIDRYFAEKHTIAELID
jgi:dTDP-4-dehydrorhamnose reductase